jgi:hypothetical protein
VGSDRDALGVCVGVEDWVKFEGAYGEDEAEEWRIEEGVDRWRQRRIR